MTNPALPPHGLPVQGSAIRPRYGRLAAFGSAVVVSAVSLLGGTGVIPTGSAAAAPHQRVGTLRLSDSPSRTATMSSVATEATSLRARSERRTARSTTAAAAEAAPLPAVPWNATTRALDPSRHPLPADSGEGRRVVFDLGEQRVWLVGPGGAVRRTYLASGSVTDNLRAGTFEVYSRSLDATGIDGTTMRHMVRFTRGDNAAIGFHDVPVDDTGHPVQRVAALGIPLSHGCIRQAPADARALWRFAQLGTTVVVTGTRVDG